MRYPVANLGRAAFRLGDAIDNMCSITRKYMETGDPGDAEAYGAQLVQAGGGVNASSRSMQNAVADAQKRCPDIKRTLAILAEPYIRARRRQEEQRMPDVVAEEISYVPPVMPSPVLVPTENPPVVTSAGMETPPPSHSRPQAIESPGGCPPGQFWDGRQCRGSIAPGGLPGGFGLEPSGGAVPFAMGRRIQVMNVPATRMGQIMPSVTGMESEGLLPSRCEQIPENRLLDRYNCELEEFKRRHQPAPPVYQQPFQPSTPRPSMPSAPPPSMPAYAPAVETGDVTIAVPPRPPGPELPPILPPGPSNQLVSFMETRGVQPSMPFPPAASPCGPNEYWDGARCLKRPSIPTVDITGQILQTMPPPASATSMTTPFGAAQPIGSMPLPGTERPPVPTTMCPPGQFWDGRQCRGSIMPGAGGLVSAAGGLAPSGGAVPFSMQGMLQPVRLVGF